MSPRSPLVAAVLLLAVFVAAPGSAQLSKGRPNLDMKVSFHLRDADLREFFQMVHEVTDWNLVLSQSVVGRLTMDVEDAFLGEVLAAVAKTNGLHYDDQGAILLVETSFEAIRREREERMEEPRAGVLREVPVTRPAPVVARRPSPPKRIWYAVLEAGEPMASGDLESGEGTSEIAWKKERIHLHWFPGFDETSGPVAIAERVDAPEGLPRLGYAVPGGQDRSVVIAFGMPGGKKDLALHLTTEGLDAITGARRPVKAGLGAHHPIRGLKKGAQFSLELELYAKKKGERTTTSQPRILTEERMVAEIRTSSAIEGEKEASVLSSLAVFGVRNGAKWELVVRQTLASGREASSGVAYYGKVEPGKWIDSGTELGVTGVEGVGYRFRLSAEK